MAEDLLLPYRHSLPIFLEEEFLNDILNITAYFMFRTLPFRSLLLSFLNKYTFIFILLFIILMLEFFRCTINEIDYILNLF